MAARSIASLTISFGLVSIPVKLYSATAGERRDLLQPAAQGSAARGCKQQYICIKDDVVGRPREDMVKGYEFAKDQYVMFTPEELKALEEAGTHTIDIAEFVPLDSDRPGLLRQGVLPRARQGRRQAVRAAGRGACANRRCALGR